MGMFGLQLRQEYMFLAICVLASKENVVLLRLDCLSHVSGHGSFCCLYFSIHMEGCFVILKGFLN